MTRVLVAVVMLAVALPVEAVSKRKQCQRACGAAITTCVETGVHRRRCKRMVMKRCRKEGVATCAIASTTTTLVSGGGPTTTIEGVLNGCDITTATDLTGRSAVAIDFGGMNGIAYIPPCFRISAGTQVTFNGDFATHPLVGGQVSLADTKEPDPASPFTPRTDSGTARAFVLDAAGAFPFYCDVHALLDMKGVAFVVP